MCAHGEPQPPLTSSLLALWTSQVSLAATAQGRVPSLSAPGQPDPVPPLFPLPSCSTKQMLADIMQFQPGDSLEEMLSLPATAEQVRGLAAHVMGVARPPAPPIPPQDPPPARPKQTSGMAWRGVVSMWRSGWSSSRKD